MKHIFALVFSVCLHTLLFAQKAPLDHSVYDGWQSIGEKKISNDGKWMLYSISVQEGDNDLILQKTDGTRRLVFSRGYNAAFSADNRYAVFKIKPWYSETRQARIKKKKPDDFPKDSLAVVTLATGAIFRTDRVKSFSLPEEGSGWVVYHREKAKADSAKKFDKTDSTLKTIDTVKAIIPPSAEPEKKRSKKKRRNDESVDDHFAEEEVTDAEGDENGAGALQEGTELVIRNPENGEEKVLPFVSEYLWSKKGNILLIEGTSNKANKKSQNTVSIWRSIENNLDTISRGGNDFRNFAIDDNGYQIAYVAERDSSSKSLEKFYKLWYWQNGSDSARVITDKNTPGMRLNWGVSENGKPQFSKSGKRLFFGTAPVRPPKDTSLADIDLVKVDIWHYNDDYLQPQQLRNLDLELKRSYMALYDIRNQRMLQLADEHMPLFFLSGEGDGDLFLGVSDVGKRIPAQWTGSTLKDLYAVDADSARRILVRKDHAGPAQISPGGKYIIWYDEKAKQYFSWVNGKTTNISSKIPFKLFDEDFDMPDEPNPYGIVRWLANDEAVLVYDRYDVWQLDPLAKSAPVNITSAKGRKTHTAYRYVSTDPEEKFIRPGQVLFFRTLNEKTKSGGWASVKHLSKMEPVHRADGAFLYNNLLKAKDSDVFSYTKENYLLSPDIYVSENFSNEIKLSSINPQQKKYNWGTAELFSWKAYDGKQATGIVYKPEDFDPKKKYPLIAYFYERLSDGLHTYQAPAPTPSRLNISFFVSRGYIVLAPDIRYRKGYPGRSAFDYVVSGARALVKKGWVDSTRMGLQGQSWGGYQAAHIITRTKLFKAAWAGAPVANMTSAYGGIRWESGLNRQFQYERSQSRIGATLWEKPQLYIENSPLFHLKNVSTPLVIMANDNDGAVPWYQGIELFTAMRRLNKKVWMLNYNGEAHNLVERKNRKDIQMREQQFFDWLLKGEKPTRWITDGVPAVMKGRDWGLEK